MKTHWQVNRNFDRRKVTAKVGTVGQTTVSENVETRLIINCVFHVAFAFLCITYVLVSKNRFLLRSTGFALALLSYLVWYTSFVVCSYCGMIDPFGKMTGRIIFLGPLNSKCPTCGNAMNTEYDPAKASNRHKH